MWMTICVLENDEKAPAADCSFSIYLLVVFMSIVAQVQHFLLYFPSRVGRGTEVFS